MEAKKPNAGTALVKHNKTWERHIINVADGKFIAKLPDSYRPYDYLSKDEFFSAHGLYVIRDRKKIGLIDRKGKWVIRPGIYTLLGMQGAFFNARKEGKLETLILNFKGKKVGEY